MASPLVWFRDEFHGRAFRDFQSSKVVSVNPATGFSDRQATRAHAFGGLRFTQKLIGVNLGIAALGSDGPGVLFASVTGRVMN